jgi:outer membrane protein OmpA-like peptidoglycan-associated protein
MSRTALIPVFALSVLCFASRPATAESGKFNLHLDLSGVVAGPPLIGGGVLHFGFDWQLKPPVALDFVIGGGGVAEQSSGIAGPVRTTGSFFVDAAAGVRLRFLDNREGYLNDKGGDAAGNLFVIPRLGVAATNNALFGTFDVTVGYEWSVARPMQVGVFLKPGFGFAPGGVIGYAMAGLNLSFEVGKAPAWDSDKDGLSDEREIMKYTTRANHADTDLDGLTDGREVLQLHTNPKDWDTDHGGSRDGWEVAVGRNPNDPSDDDQDQDKVVDEHDACLGTPPGTEVDQRGCAVLRRQMVLDGITFQLGSAEILPSSEATLKRAAQSLVDNPGVSVEIGGHTDDLGKPDYNQRLSESRAQAVAEWLATHGVDRARMQVRGYGNTQPKAPNDSEANRARNRRIEFKRL